MTLLRAILIAAILWTGVLRSLEAEPAAPAQERSAAAPVSPLAEQPLDRFSAMRDRPLFSPTRRPPAPPPVAAAPPPPPPLPPPDLALLGVVMDGDNAGAIVRAGPTAKIARVHIGDQIAGWTVGQIEARKLVLLLNGRTATFNMFSGNSTHRSPPLGSTARPPGSEQPNSTQLPQTSMTGSAATNSEYPHVRRPHLQQQ
jgi:hypothetical protein